MTAGGWAIPFYVAAAGTGLARIYGDRHWLSDVVVGGFIGWWVGGGATRAAARRLGVPPRAGGALETTGATAPSAPVRPRIEPLIAADRVGIQIRFGH